MSKADHMLLQGGTIAWNATYLGDSVYAGQDNDGRVWLWLDNGEGPYSEICIEPETLRAFNAYMERLVRE